MAVLCRFRANRQSHLISSTIETQIAPLTAYRKSLIHGFATGQRRVGG